MFKTSEDINAFRSYLKKIGANSNYRMGVQYQGKATHSATALPLDKLPFDLQKRVARIVIKNNTIPVFD